MIGFIAGLFIGGALGVALMAILEISKDDREDRK